MSGFSDPTLVKKLTELNNSAQSIQQLSLWLIHHRKHYQTVVKVWCRELFRVPSSRKLTFLYLSNDVVQNSRKKSPEYAKEFGSVLKKVLEHLAALALDGKTIKSIGRLLNIWKERAIFEGKVQAELCKIWAAKEKEGGSSTEQQKGSGEPSAKRSKKESPRKKPEPAAAAASNGTKNGATTKASDMIQNLLSPVATSESEAAAILLEAEEDSVAPGDVGDPPDAEELISALQELENAASSDAVVREQIARLPEQVSVASSLDTLKSPEEGQKLMTQIDQASQLLNQYNERLQTELKERRKVSKMIRDFMAAQRDLEAQAEERLEQYREKLDKVNSVRDDLRAHIQSLPDLSKLPDVTGGLAPLPSAGDLFTK